MKLMRFLLVLLITVSTTGLVKANKVKIKFPGDSVIRGSIINFYTKKPIGDVTVLLAPAGGGAQFKRELKSNAFGFFTFPQLPPGEFTLQLQKKGYKTYRKDYVMMKEGLEVKLSLQEEDDDSDVDAWNPLKMLYGR